MIKRNTSFRSKLLAILATAAVAPMMTACCEVRTSTTVITTGDGGVAPGEAGCAQFCQMQTRGCGGDYDRVECSPGIAANGQPGVACTVTYTSCPTRPTLAVCGRRPGGFEDEVCDHDESVAELFARMARLEGAAVSAFEILSRELSAHGAPANLVRGAARAARDEAQHERLMRTLAGSAAKATPAATNFEAVRSLEAIAIENAIEGCVRETYGALVALWQSRSARKPGVRDVMRRIARDETSHAALAWKVDAWARSQLDPEACARLDAAVRDAIEDLASACETTVTDDLVAVAGVPQRDVARMLLGGAKRVLWS